MTLRPVIATLAVAAVLLAPAQAAVRYTMEGFTSESPTGLSPVSFSLTVADFITVDTSFAVGALDACSNPTSSCQGVRFNMDGIEYNTPPLYPTAGLQVVEFVTQYNAYFHYFAPTPDLPFSTPGRYATVFDFHPATLTVEVVTNVPEPLHSTLLLAGLGALVTWTRRRDTR